MVNSTEQCWGALKFLFFYNLFLQIIVNPLLSRQLFAPGGGGCRIVQAVPSSLPYATRRRDPRAKHATAEY